LYCSALGRAWVVTGITRRVASDLDQVVGHESELPL
jgi:hypothetical protein